LGQNYYLQFINRKQKFEEDLASLGAELEQLARLAYSECSVEVRDKIAYTQFIAANSLSDRFIKRTLQLEEVNSLRMTIEKASAIRVIQNNSFPKKTNFYRENKYNSEGNSDKKRNTHVNFKQSRIKQKSVSNVEK
jgi:hypothetical protein